MGLTYRYSLLIGRFPPVGIKLNGLKICIRNIVDFFDVGLIGHRQIMRHGASPYARNFRKVT